MTARPQEKDEEPAAAEPLSEAEWDRILPSIARATPNGRPMRKG